MADERFGAVAAEAADLAGIKDRFAVGAVPGFEPLAALGDDGLTPAVAAHARRADAVHVRHLRPSQGRAPPADRAGPGRGHRAQATWFFGLFGLAPYDDHVHLCGSPLYHTAVLNFAAISLQLGHPWC